MTFPDAAASSSGAVELPDRDHKRIVQTQETRYSFTVESPIGVSHVSLQYGTILPFFLRESHGVRVIRLQQKGYLGTVGNLLRTPGLSPLEIIECSRGMPLFLESRIEGGEDRVERSDFLLYR